MILKLEWRCALSEMKRKVLGGGGEEGLHLKVLLPCAPEPCQSFLQGVVLKSTTAFLTDLFLPRSIMYKLYTIMYKLYKETRNRTPVHPAERTRPVGYEKISPCSVSTCVLRYLLYRAPLQQE